jgi:hypothetical protein
MSRSTDEQRGTISQTISSHQFLFGILIAVLLAGVMIIVDTLFPSIERDLLRHEQLEDGVFLTIFFFVVYVYCFWSSRRRPGFWFALCIFFVLHVTGVLVYSVYVHPPVLWQWSVLGIFEGYAAALFVGSWTSRQARREARGWWRDLWG